MTLRAAGFRRADASQEPQRPAISLWTPFDAEEKHPAAEAASSDEPGAHLEQATLREREAELAAAIAALARAKTDIESRAAALDAHYRACCAKTLAQIIAAAAPAICETAARTAIARVFDETARTAAPPSLTLASSADIFAALGGDAAATLLMDDTLAPGTLVARWRDGGLDCDVGRSLFAIVDFLNAQTKSTKETCHHDE